MSTQQELGTSKELVNQILLALKENAAIMGEMTAEMRSINNQIASLKAAQEETENIVREIKIKKYIIEDSIKQLGDSIEKLKENLESIGQEKKEDKKNNFNNKILIFIAIMGALATIIAAFIQIYPTLHK
jgi:dynactin complex subunit